MTLTINNLPAVLSENADFTFFVESSLFKDAAGYSLDIELPLKGCKENREIFGFIELNPPASAEWPATLDLGGVTMAGQVLLTEVTQSSVKVQFVKDKAPGDTDDLPIKRYISELSLGANKIIDFDQISAKFLQSSYDYQQTNDFKRRFISEGGVIVHNRIDVNGVVLPWINDTEDTHQNWLDGASTDNPTFSAMAKRVGLSWFPYLLPLAKKIAAAIGYSCYFGDWENSELRNIIVCNALPPSCVGTYEYSFARALPRWTVEEFFENIQPLLNGVFHINNCGRSITFIGAKSILSRYAVECPEMVDDGHEIESSYGMEDVEGQYLTSKPYRYADAGTEDWKYQDCQWYLNTIDPTRVKEYSEENCPNGIQSMLDDMQNHAKNKLWHHYVFHYAPDDVYAIYQNQPTITDNEDGSYIITNSISPRFINIFGPQPIVGVSEDDQSFEELNYIPADTSTGVIRLAPENAFDAVASISEGGPGYDGSEEILPEGGTIKADSDAEIEDLVYQTTPMDEIENGEPDAETHYEHLIVGYWDGSDSQMIPATTGLRLSLLWKVNSEKYSFRLAGQSDGEAIGPYNGLPKIDESTKMIFYIYSNRLPEVDAEFNIHGERYICRRLEATFTARGMSECIKGEFYRIMQ